MNDPGNDNTAQDPSICGSAGFANHSNGKIWPIISHLIEIGLDVLHPFLPRSMDRAEARWRRKPSS